MEMTEAYYLKIHWDNHHCSSCHEASDEWNRHYVLQDMAEVNDAIAEALANPEAARLLRVDTHMGSYVNVLKCPAVRDGQNIYLLTDPCNEDNEVLGEKVDVDLAVIQSSPAYEQARIAKVQRQEQAKRDEAESRVRQEIEAKKKLEEDERKKLAELKAKYGDKP